VACSPNIVATRTRHAHLKVLCMQESRDV